MRNRWILILLLSLLFVGQAFAAGEQLELQVRTSKPGAIVTVERETKASPTRY